MAGINDKEQPSIPKAGKTTQVPETEGIKTVFRNSTFFENMKAKLGDLNYRVQEYLREKIEKPVSEKFKNRTDNNQYLNKPSILEKVYAKLNGTDHKGYVEEQKRELNQEKLAAELKNNNAKKISGNVINKKESKEIAQGIREKLNPSYKSSIQTPSSSFSPHDTPGTSKKNNSHGIVR
ncbi:hypothetical protein [Rickettsia endosymbiont of Polydrusus tereticollis]|uniref:hypothetical protein n=1 Tax=Rickettsia endosymbiont of Polydrusus tereticollis TaxID=3066251 RepID=UPI003133385B